MKSLAEIYGKGGSSSLQDKYKKPTNNSNYIPVLSDIAGAGAYGAKAVGDSLGNFAQFAGDVTSAFDPVSQAQNIYKAVSGQDFGYKSPFQVGGDAVKSATDYLGEGVIKGAKTMGIDEGSTTANIGYGLGSLASTIGTAAITPQLGNTGLLKKVIPQSILDTYAQIGASTGKVANAGDLATGALIDSSFYGLGKFVKGLTSGKVSQKLYDLAIDPNAKEAELLQKSMARGTDTPITTAQTARDLNLFGTEQGLGVKAVKKSDELFEKTINPIIENTDQKFNVQGAFEEIEDKISSIAERGRKKDMEAALQALKNDYKGVKDIDFATAQKIKQGLDKFTPQKAWKGQEISGAYAQIKKEFADKIRTSTYDLLPDETIKKAYIDWGNLQNLAKKGQSAMTNSKFKGGTGGFISAMKDKAITPTLTGAGALLEKIRKSANKIPNNQTTKVMNELLKKIARTATMGSDR